MSATPPPTLPPPRVRRLFSAWRLIILSLGLGLLAAACYVNSSYFIRQQVLPQVDRDLQIKTSCEDLEFGIFSGLSLRRLHSIGSDGQDLLRIASLDLLRGEFTASDPLRIEIHGMLLHLRFDETGQLTNIRPSAAFQQQLADWRKSQEPAADKTPHGQEKPAEDKPAPAKPAPALQAVINLRDCTFICSRPGPQGNVESRLHVASLRIAGDLTEPALLTAQCQLDLKQLDAFLLDHCLEYLRRHPAAATWLDHLRQAGCASPFSEVSVHGQLKLDPVAIGHRCTAALKLQRLLIPILQGDGSYAVKPLMMNIDLELNLPPMRGQAQPSFSKLEGQALLDGVEFLRLQTFPAVAPEPPAVALVIPLLGYRIPIQGKIPETPEDAPAGDEPAGDEPAGDEPDDFSPAA